MPCDLGLTERYQAGVSGYAEWDLGSSKFVKVAVYSDYLGGMMREGVLKKN